MIGIIGAMQTETEALVLMLEDKKTEVISGREYHQGKLFGRDTVICTCGIGKVFAAICAEAIILRYRPDILINTGVAGAISETLNVTDIVVSNSVVQHDMDTSPIGDPVGLISGINKIFFDADKACADKIENIVNGLGIHAERGLVASGDQFIAGKEAKGRIRALFPETKCCEMEGAAIGHCAYVNGVPFVVVRAISDNADGTGSMDYMQFCDIAAKNSIKVICEFVKQY